MLPEGYRRKYSLLIATHLILKIHAMKKRLIFILLFVFSFAVCSADGKKEVVNVKDIPSEAQKILNTHFANYRVSSVIKESEFTEIEFEVRFENGVEIDFDSSGIWKKIDCRMLSVPEKLIPAEILHKVQQSFPKTKIVEIEKDRRGFDVELDNGIDLKFDKIFNMKIDD